MIVFENRGEIDPQLIALLGVNVKEGEDPIGWFGTGLKISIACLARWHESIVIQSGLAEFRFDIESATIRGKEFGVLVMRSRYDNLRLGFTTELGKSWEPWMIYRELHCNARDEPEPHVYESSVFPQPKAGLTRCIVDGPMIQGAHEARKEFLLLDQTPLHVVEGLELYPGPGEKIFYRGIAVQNLNKPSLYTYNITEQVLLTEDRTAGEWATDPWIAKGLALLPDPTVVDATLLAPDDKMEPRLDYGWVWNPGPTWVERAQHWAATRPNDIPSSVRRKYVKHDAKICPTCKRPLPAADADPVPF